MAEVLLSQTLRQLRGALPMTATGTIVMSPRSAGDFLAALDILTDQARKLEAEVDRLRWRLGAARDGVRNTANLARAGAVEIAEPSDPHAEALERLARREAEIARRASFVAAGPVDGKGWIKPTGGQNVTVFPIVARPRPRPQAERPTHDEGDDCA